MPVLATRLGVRGALTPASQVVCKCGGGGVLPLGCAGPTAIGSGSGSRGSLSGPRHCRPSDFTVLRLRQATWRPLMWEKRVLLESKAHYRLLPSAFAPAQS